jgi:hypothetical protein
MLKPRLTELFGLTLRSRWRHWVRAPRAAISLRW